MKISFTLTFSVLLLHFNLLAQDKMMQTMENCQVAVPGHFNNDYSISWSGKCMNGLATGYGYLRTFYKDELSHRYKGELLDGYKEGQGIDTISNNYIIQGTFKKGKPHGNCTWITSNGLVKFEGEYVNGEPIHGKMTYKRFDEKKEILSETLEGKFIKGKLIGQGERCYPCTESFAIVYNWVKCWERGEFRDGKLYNGTSYEPVITRYQTGSSTGNPDYYTYTNGIKKRVENTSSSSDNSSSSSSSNNDDRNNADKKDEVDYERIEHPGVDKIDDWEEENSLTDGRYYVTAVTFEDGINGFLYKGGSSGDHFIENSGGANYYYKNYDAALRALYVYKKYGEIIKRGAK